MSHHDTHTIVHVDADGDRQESFHAILVYFEDATGRLHACGFIPDDTITKLCHTLILDHAKRFDTEEQAEAFAQERIDT